MAKDIIFKENARQRIKDGIDKLADAVKTTLGPKGNDVVIASYYGNNKPHITKDGVTVAKNIELADPTENAGACIIREAALKTVSTCGDATTTSIVLSQALVDKAEEVLNEVDPNQLKMEIDACAEDVVQKICDKSIPIKDEDVFKIATISANNDKSIGTLIADAYKEIGRDGIVMAEESKTVHTYNEIIQGMQFDSGYIANHFVTDKEKDQCVLYNPYVFITEHRIDTIADLLNILKPIAKDKASIFIVAQDYDDSALENFKMNHLQGVFKCCLIKAPSFGNYRKGLLEDLAVLTGGTVLTYESGLNVADADSTFLGQCERIIVTKDKTTFIKGLGSKEEIEKRAEELTTQLKQVEESPGMDESFMLKFLKERKARLLGGICTIHVGGTTELEMKERMDRVDDAICAVQAALKQGIVRGGGVTYRDIAATIKGDTFGEKVIKAALNVPFDTLLDNAGILHLALPENAGVDLNTKTRYEDILEAGVIDPTLACLQAFTNAISVVKLYLSTACVIAPIPITIM